jgi:hypothetical protein
VTPHAELFDADFRLLLGFFVLNNFSALLRYHEQRARIGQLGIDRNGMVRAMVAVLPCEARKLEVRPSRWRHYGVPPVDQPTKEALAALVNTVRQDKARDRVDILLPSNDLFFAALRLVCVSCERD